jgi:carboxypeptidase C (cathepsin A)
VDNVPKHAKHTNASKEIVAIKDKCRKSCGKVVESGCAPECQVKAFACLDYDRTTKPGAEAYQACEKTSMSTYEKYSQDWESTHPRLVALLVKRGYEHINGAEMDSIQDQCREACGEGVDASCVTECQVNMYQCLDFDKETPDGLKKYEACEKEAMEKYKAFAADWDVTHPHLMAIGKHVGAKKLQLVHDRCVSGCKPKSDGSCIPRCEVSSYSCFSSNDLSDVNLETCIEKATSETSAGSKETAPTVGQVEEIEAACRSNCGLGADSSCSPECQVQMYACSGNGKQKQNANEKADEYLACTKSVLQRYEKFSLAWNAAHPHLLAARGHADASDLDELHEECEEACGPNVDSTCVPECHVKIYACLDQKHPNDNKPYKQCTQKVLASYEHFADDWDAAHPYLLAVRKHTSEAQLKRVSDKCQEACGKGVDSSCVPECQVEMYACLDHDPTVPESAKLYEECEAKVLAEYKDFGKDWEASHPY